VVQAKEFHGIRLKSYEKKLYKQINGANGIKFPIKVDLAMHAHKRSLILQAELGGVEFPPDEQYAKHKRQFNQDKAMLFSHIHRLIHCVIDCQLYLQDAVAVRHALELARSFSARVWDNSPYQLKQIAQIGLVAIRKLATAGINSIEALEAAEPHQIEMHLSRNPPFGQKLLENLVDFPKLRVSVKLMGKEAGRGLPVKIKIKAECGFMNEKVPVTFHRKQLYICLLTERSDGQLVDFKRISARNLNKGKDFLMSAELLSHTQYITSYVMCDSVAGTIRHAELKPDLPAHLFPPLQPERRGPVNTQRNSGHNEGAQRDGGPSTSPVTLENDEFGECEIEDQDMVDVVAGVDFRHVDNIATGSLGRKSRSNPQEQKVANAEGNVWNPERLDNGKWACNHKCKDKTTCKHMCCREGVDKAPKAPKSAFVSAGSLVDASMLPGRKDTHPPLPSKGKAIPSKTNAREDQSKIETLDLAHDPYIGTRTQSTSSRELQSLQRLHDSVVKGPATPVIARRRHSHECDKQGRPQLPARTRNKPVTNTDDGLSTDYDGDWMSGLPSPTALLGKDSESGEQFLRESANCFNGERDGCPFPLDRPRKSAVTTQDQFDDDSLEDFDLSQFNQDDERSDLEAAMVGLSDSITMNEDSQVPVALNGGYQDKAVAERLPPKDRHFASPASLPARNDSNASSKLFLSTDSPEKLVDGPDKGPEAIVSEANEAEDSLSLSAPAPKRQRMCGQADAALQPSWRTAHQVAPAAATIKPGQPAWVYEFDPAFIAEWQDFVDFV